MLSATSPEMAAEKSGSDYRIGVETSKKETWCSESRLELPAPRLSMEASIACRVANPPMKSKTEM
jgi:hypothetical protein